MALEVEFDPKSDEVKPEHRDDLARVANFLKANPEVTATVEGHTGNMQKTEAGAMKMSQRRAENVVTYLVDNFGIARSRLSAEGFGGTRHFAYNTTLEGQQENRRVNIIINYPKRKNP
jgi:OOP family OmpA-OmpF porin